ncbi:MAG: hypothetical protein H6767_07865 [Candidatus Peribacteria bacterium]|nr:MAG: hypothetical protein H6767_07865 [Candidatus Peribacteria bacterium]
MEIQKRIISELKNPKFLDLGFLYSDEALKDALVLLRDLLAQERQSFAVLLRTPKEEITFDTFEDEGLLDYYWSLLNHLKSVDDSPKIRKIIETFRPELQEFSHEVSYSKPYYEMLVYCFHHTDLDKEQKRSLSLRIERFESRGIHLAEKEQTDLKDLNQELSKLAETFSNNILDDEAEFEYVIEDVESIKELPADILSQAKGAYQSKYPDTKKDAYLF